MKTYDVAIIGGGPAGLSAALVLGRARRSTIVFDAGTPRNSYSPGVYGFPSRDGVLPAALKAEVRAELARYGCVENVAATVRRFESYKRHSYVIEDDRGRLTRVQKVILAVGMVDVFPSWTGFTDLWGKDIMHCAHCHGWENRDRHWGIVADDVQAVAAAHQFRAWTDRVTVFADPELRIPAAAQSKLDKVNIDIVRCRIHDLILSSNGRLSGIKTEHGNEFPCQTLAYAPPQRAPELIRAMRIRTNRIGRVAVNEQKETNLSRVFAVGDITPGPQNALAAVTEGAAVAKSIIPDIVIAAAAFDRLQRFAPEQPVAQLA
jgi:thioredoxin reductase